MRDILGWDDGAVDAAVTGGPTRFLGDGRHPIGATTAGDYAVVFVEDASGPIVRLTSFDAKGLARDDALRLDTGTTALLTSNPVVAGLGAGKYVAAFVDFDGDGDEEGVALRVVDTAAASVGPLRYANLTTDLSQYDVDLLVVGSQIIVAWTDNSSATTGADIKVRTFDTALTPTSGETTLAATTSAENQVVLAPFETSWIAAWKVSDAGLETLQVHSDTKDWHVGPYLPGPSSTHAALVELDASHVLGAFLLARSDGTYALHAAVLDVAGTGAPADFEITPMATTDAGVAPMDIRDVDLVRVGDALFVAWRSAAIAGDANGDDVWLKPLRWTGTALELSAAEMPLPRRQAHVLGDQRHPALAATGLVPGGALATAWVDYAQTLAAPEANQDVVEELIPIPILRSPDADGGTP